MADRRRRRLSENDSGEEFAEAESDSAEKARPSECESEAEPTDVSLSELDSTADDSRPFVETEEETETEDESGEEDDDTAEEDEEAVDEERQSGDGEEQPNKNLDDDEDKKNPAYIPRKGAFYEHDMRLDLEQGVEEPPREEKRGKGKLWEDDSRWLHDKFDTSLQAPKSRDELITMYGYDITLDDKPPENPPKMYNRPKRGRARFGDYIDGAGDRRRKSYGPDRGPYDENTQENEFPALQDPRPSRSDPTETRDYQDRRRGQRGGRGRDQRGGHRGQRSNYSDMRDENQPRNKGYEERDREDFDDNRGHKGFKDNREHQYDNRREHYEKNEGSEKYQDRQRGFSGDKGYNRNRGGYEQRGDNYNQKVQPSIGRDGDSNRSEGYSQRGFDNRQIKSEPDRDRYTGRDNVGRSDRGGYGDRRAEDYKGSYQKEEPDNYADRNYGDRRGNARDNRNNRGGKDTGAGKRGGGGGGARGGGSGRDGRDNRENRDTQSYTDKPYHSANTQESTAKPSSSGKPLLPTTQTESYTSSMAKDPRNTDVPESSVTHFKNSLGVPSSGKSYEKPSPKSYYTLSPVTDEEKQFMGENDYDDPDFSLQSVQKGVADLNVTVTSTGNRRSFPKQDKQGPPKPRNQNYGSKPAGQMEDRGRREDSQLQGQSQQGSKRYSSQRQRNPDVTSGNQPLQYPTEPPQMVPVISQGGPVSVASPTGMVIPRGPPPFMQVPVGPRPATIAQLPVTSPRTGPIATLSHQVGLPPRLPAAANQTTSPPPPCSQPPMGGVSNPIMLVAPTHTSSGGVAVPIMTHPPLIAPGMMFAAAPPPNFQMAVQPFPTTPPPPQLSVATVASVTQSQQIPPLMAQPLPHGEQVRGGTTYYNQSQAPPPAPPKASASTITYYSPEMQVSKKKQQPRRPKAAIPIVNPQDIKKGEGQVVESKLEDKKPNQKFELPDVKPGTEDPGSSQVIVKEPIKTPSTTLTNETVKSTPERVESTEKVKTKESEQPNSINKELVASAKIDKDQVNTAVIESDASVKTDGASIQLNSAEGGLKVGEVVQEVKSDIEKEGKHEVAKESREAMRQEVKVEEVKEMKWEMVIDKKKEATKEDKCEGVKEVKQEVEDEEEAEFHETVEEMAEDTTKDDSKTETREDNKDTASVSKED